jgi:hypothetical protein
MTMKDDDFSYQDGGDCCSPMGRQGRMTMGHDGKVQLPRKPEPPTTTRDAVLRSRVAPDQPKAQM